MAWLCRCGPAGGTLWEGWELGLLGPGTALRQGRCVNPANGATEVGIGPSPLPCRFLWGVCAFPEQLVANPWLARRPSFFSDDPISSPHSALSLFLLLGDQFSKVPELGQVALSLFKGLKEIMKTKQAKERVTERERQTDRH